MSQTTKKMYRMMIALLLIFVCSLVFFSKCQGRSRQKKVSYEEKLENTQRFYEAEATRGVVSERFLTAVPTVVARNEATPAVQEPGAEEVVSVGGLSVPWPILLAVGVGFFAIVADSWRRRVR